MAQKKKVEKKAAPKKAAKPAPKVVEETIIVSEDNLKEKVAISNEGSGFLTQEQKDALIDPIDNFIADLQSRVDDLRKDGETKVAKTEDDLKRLHRSKEYTNAEKDKLYGEFRAALKEAKAVKKQNAKQIREIIKEGETYLKEHYNSDYYKQLVADIKNRSVYYKKRHDAELKNLKEGHVLHRNAILEKYKGVKDKEELKNKKTDLDEEMYVYSNRIYEEENAYRKICTQLKDEKHEAYIHKYQLIDKLRNSHFTFTQNIAQKAENKKYTFRLKEFLLGNGLYIAIIAVFIILCIVAVVRDQNNILTVNNVFKILENSSTRVFFALGVAGLILLGGTDLSIGRMIGLSMTITAMFWHDGVNAIQLFGNKVDLSGLPFAARLLLPLLISVVLCGCLSGISGFFTAKFKMHPFISTLGMQLIIFGLWFYATKGTNSGGVEDSFINAVAPTIGGVFPALILWAIACILVVWFIWNKTKFGKHMYAVGGNSEAAAVSGISVFWVIIITFVMAGILYGMGGWLEAARARGSASASSGSGWETDAIAACVVGGISFSGGVGKIGGAVFGVIVFTALTFALTLLNIDTNLQFVIKGVIIIAAVSLDCMKYLKKK